MGLQYTLIEVRDGWLVRERHVSRTPVAGIAHLRARLRRAERIALHLCALQRPLASGPAAGTMPSALRR